MVSIYKILHINMIREARSTSLSENFWKLRIFNSVAVFDNRLKSLKKNQVRVNEQSESEYCTVIP